MRFLSKLCVLAMVAYVSASPKIEHRAEGESGYDFSKFLGKIPEYFKTPEGLNGIQQPSTAESGTNSEIQHDAPAQNAQYPNLDFMNQFGGSNNPYASQFKQCMGDIPSQFPTGSDPNYSGSNGQSGGSGGGYNMQNPEEYRKKFEECRKKMTESFSAQGYENYVKPPQGLPQGFPNWPGSGSSNSNSATGSSNV